MSRDEWFQESAIAACERWDGRSNADLMELIREEFNQTIDQFYGLDRNGDTWRELATMKEQVSVACDQITKSVRSIHKGKTE